MKSKDAIRLALLVLRLTAFPFPITVGVLLIVSNFLYGRIDGYGDPYSDASISDAGVEVGQMIMAAFLVMIQLFWGGPSVLVLEKTRIGIGGYTVVGLFTAITLSLLLALVLSSSRQGEAFHASFGWTLLIFGIPLTYSYMLAFWVCRWCEKRWPNQSVEPTAGCAFSFDLESKAGGGSR